MLDNIIPGEFGTRAVPPHNEAAEQALLGAILISNNIMLIVSDIVRADDFYLPVHGRIYEAMQTVINQGQVANPVTLKGLFDVDHALTDIGGAGYLARLAGTSVGVTTAQDFARVIKDTAARRHLLEISEDIQSRARDFDTPAGEQIERAEADLFALGERAPGDVSTMAAAFHDMLEYAEKSVKGEIVAVNTGIVSLDGILSGLMPGDFSIVAGRPGMGKTALGMAVALHNARQGRPVGFLSLEMPKRQLSARVISGMTNIPPKMILNGGISSADWDAVMVAGKELSKLPLHIDDRAGADIDQIISRGRAMRRRFGIELLILDYIGLVQFGSEGRYEGTTNVSQKMKTLARTMNSHVLGLHQINRNNEARENKRPALSDLRDSGALEQDADVVMFAYREEYYLARKEPDPGDLGAYSSWRAEMNRAQGQAEVIVAKHRNGGTGTALTRFDGPTTAFGDAA